MATRMLELDGYPAIGERARPALKLVENVPPAKLPPPAWMVAPTFRTEIAIGVEEQALQRGPMTMPAQGPYRSIREVPRAG
ncbi:hypothetical protein [Rhizorhabdus argentea]|uniref:hypothetical protein n=1 Tax=Rhizorhabdus argentea TaxID=1387174 RepID=UPI0030EB3DA7